MSWSKYNWVNDSSPAIDAVFLNNLDDEIIRLDSAKVGKSGNETVAGIKTFSSSPIVPTPTTDSQVATKKYVDDEVSGIEGVTTSSVLSAISGASFGDVGTYAILNANNLGSSGLYSGQTTSGSNLSYQPSQYVTEYMVGTWLNVGQRVTNGNKEIFLRIA